jgi:hypothetical protein
MEQRTWKATSDRLQKPCYLSRVDNDNEIRNRKQRRDVGKCSFLNWTLQLWIQLFAHALGALSTKPNILREKVIKVIHQVK